MLIDTHCHIDMYSNPIQVLTECETKEVIVISMTNLPSHFELGINHFRNKKKVRQALGFHPLFIKNYDAKELLKFKNLVNQTSYIGEIGLDFSKEGIDTKNVQVQIFQKILSVIRDSSGDKILSLHSRGAEKEVLGYLIENNIKHAIFHWYSGKIDLIPDVIKEGYYFSINSAMIKSKKGNEIIDQVPLNRILIESDGPYIDLNGSPILPYQLDSVYFFLAKKYKLSLDELKNIIKQNFYHLISSLK